MAFMCPYCGRHGIAFRDRLFTSAALGYRRTVSCRHCRKPARLSKQVVRLQYALFIAALATIPWLFVDEERLAAAVIMTGVIVVLGMLGPLSRRIT